MRPVIALIVLLFAHPAAAELLGRGLIPATTPGAQCRAAIARAEIANGLPPRLLGAIGRIESGRRSLDGHVDPWPWSINAEGVDHVYETKAEAVAAVRSLQAQGVRSIDVGCLQVNLMYHADAFATLDDGFDPQHNAAYAARFLRRLYGQTGTWEAATAAYHSATPELGGPYAARVLAVLPQEAARLQPAVPAPVSRPAALGPLLIGTAAARSDTGGHILLMPAGSSGRGLAAYRAAPVRVMTLTR